MRGILSLLFFTAFLYPCMQYAQSHVKYEFDCGNAGNCIRKTIIETRSAKAANPLSGEKEISAPDVYHDNIEGFDIKIYPNPTNGNLKISIHSGQSIGSSLLELTTLNGKQILAQSGLKQETNLNIGDKPSGMYLIDTNKRKSRPLENGETYKPMIGGLNYWFIELMGKIRFFYFGFVKIESL